MEERSTDPGVVSDLERLAMRGEEMPDGLSLADQEFFSGIGLHIRPVSYEGHRQGNREQGEGKTETCL